MWKNSSFEKLYRVLAPHVRPQLGKLALIAVFASVVAFGEKAPFLLLQPLFDGVVFKQKAEPAGDLNPASRAIADTFGSVREHVAQWVFGAQGAQSAEQQQLAVLGAVGSLIVLLT